MGTRSPIRVVSSESDRSSGPSGLGAGLFCPANPSACRRRFERLNSLAQWSFALGHALSLSSLGFCSASHNKCSFLQHTHTRTTRPRARARARAHDQRNRPTSQHSPAHPRTRIPIYKHIRARTHARAHARTHTQHARARTHAQCRPSTVAARTIAPFTEESRRWIRRIRNGQPIADARARTHTYSTRARVHEQCRSSGHDCNPHRGVRVPAADPSQQE